MRRLLIVLLSIVVVACTTPPDAHSPTEKVDYNRLKHKTGVYALSSVGSRIPSELSLDYLLMPYQPAANHTRRTLSRGGVRVIDSWIQQAIYSTYCRRGPHSCQEPNDETLHLMLSRIRAHLIRNRLSTTVSAYYLTDDFRISLRHILPSVRKLIRVEAPRAPTVCGFPLPLGGAGATSGAQQHAVAYFGRALVNYSPRWCDSVALYSYGPTTTRPNRSAIDWSMNSTLPIALGMLEARGWSHTPHSLIGVPQAFGYWPRTIVRGRRLATPQYLRLPSPGELVRQIRSFCAHGAGSIVAYVWNDGSSGDVMELSNSEMLREAFSEGIRVCRSVYWDD